MIAKFKNKYFNISLAKNPVRLWRYDNVEGFNVKEKSDGLIVYEKFVELDELDEVFDAGFSAKCCGKWCGALPLKSGKIQLITEDSDIAKKYNMEEFDREVYRGIVENSVCTEFRLIKENMLTREKEEKLLTEEEFVRWYQLLRRDLTPQRT